MFPVSTAHTYQVRSLLQAMLPHNRKILEASFPLFTPLEIQRELSLWEKLVFSFDMDNEQASGSKPSRSRTGSRSESNSATHQDGSSNPSDVQSDAQNTVPFAYLVPPARVSQAFNQQPYPQLPPSEEHSQGYQDQYFQHLQIGHPQALPPSLHLPWLEYQHSATPQISNPQQMGISLPNYPYGTSPHAPHANVGIITPLPGHGSETPAVASTSASPPEAENQTEGERAASNEEKRRRNTAASARFRIKKKQRTTNLEHSVSDLTGRAEELEREAAELRRENGWLKEIVMLKGSRLAGATFPQTANPFLHGATQDSSNKPPSESGEPSDEKTLTQSKGPRTVKAKREKSNTAYTPHTDCCLN
ncbi:hypothetical protein BD779DRAFT_9613 [Infundibulicybe gibba]|nr:hypothetical protein BD779DRAFT_9613 [Infundibulicybe gibba]